MTGAVDVGVVTVLSCELNVGSRDGNTTLALLRGLVNGGIVEEVGKTLRGLVLGDGGSQGGLWTDGLNFMFEWQRCRNKSRIAYLAVIDVTNGAWNNLLARRWITRQRQDLTNVHVGLGTLESSRQSTAGHLVAEDMVDGVDGSRTQQGGPASARQKVQ